MRAFLLIAAADAQSTTESQDLEAGKQTELVSWANCVFRPLEESKLISRRQLLRTWGQKRGWW